MGFQSDLRSLLSPSTLEMNTQTIDPYLGNGNSGLVEVASVGVNASLLSANMSTSGGLLLLPVIPSPLFARCHLVTLAHQSSPSGTHPSSVSLDFGQFLWLTVCIRVGKFFWFHPHATRLFHSGNFMTSLSYPPDHPDFPIAPVLHAICAVSAIYTAVGGPRTNAADFPCKYHLSSAAAPIWLTITLRKTKDNLHNQTYLTHLQSNKQPTLKRRWRGT